MGGGVGGGLIWGEEGGECSYESVFFDRSKKRNGRKNTRPPAGPEPTFRAGELIRKLASVFFRPVGGRFGLESSKRPGPVEKTLAVEKTLGLRPASGRLSELGN